MNLEASIKIKPEDSEEFKTFLMTFHSDQSEIVKFMKVFDEWVSEHRGELRSLYDKEPPDHEFITWARRCFFNFVFNTYKNDLSSQIDELIGG